MVAHGLVINIPMTQFFALYKSFTWGLAWYPFEVNKVQFRIARKTKGFDARLSWHWKTTAKSEARNVLTITVPIFNANAVIAFA